MEDLNTPQDQDAVGSDSATPSDPQIKPTVNVFGAVLDGMVTMGKDYNPDAHASTFLEQRSNATPVLPDIESAWKQSANTFGGDRGMFEGVYQTASKMYKDIQSTNYNFPPVQTGLAAGLGVQNKAFQLITDKNPNHYVGAEKLGHEPISSNQEIAQASGVYKDKQGGIRTLYNLDKDKSNMLYYEQDRDQYGNFVGDPYLKEAKDNELLYGKELYSLWGPQALSGSALPTSAKALFNTAVVGAGQGISDIYHTWIQAPVEKLVNTTRFLSNFGDEYYTDDNGNKLLVDWKGTGNDFDNDPEWQKKRDDTPEELRMRPGAIVDMLSAKTDAKNSQIHAAYEAFKAPIPVSATQGWSESLSSFNNEFFSGLGNLVVTNRAMSLRAMTLGKAGAGVSRAMFQDQINKKMIRSGIAIGTVQMMPALYSEARESGLDNEHAMAFTLACVPGVALAESAFGAPWMAKYFTRAGSREELKNGIKAELKDYLKYASDEEASRIARLNASKNTTSRLYNNIKTFYKDNLEASTFTGKAMRAVEGGKAEFAEEGMEEAFYNGIKDIHDSYFADKDATEGKGKFGMKFFSMKSANSIFSNAVMGGSVGSAMGGFRSPIMQQYKENVLKKAVVNDDGKFVEDYINELHRQGNLGETFVDKDGNTINSTQQADGSSASMNDVNKESILQELNYYRELKSQLGLNAETYKDLDANKNLFLEAIDLSKTQNELADKIKNIEEKKAEASGKGLSTEGFDSQIEPLKKEQELAGKRLADIKSGKAVEQKIKNVSIDEHFQSKKLSQEQSALIPSSTHVDEFNSQVSEHNTYVEEKRIEDAKKRQEQNDVITSEVGKLKTIDVTKDFSSFKAKYDEIQTLIDSSVKGSADASLKDVLASVNETKNNLFKQMESIVPQGEVDVNSPVYEEDVFASASKVDKALAKNFTEVSSMVEQQTAAQQQAGSTNEKTLNDNQREKQNAVDSYSKYFDKEAGTTQEGVSFDDMLSSIEKKGDTMTPTDVENLKALATLIDIRKNTATINSEVYPKLKYHAKQANETKIDNEQATQIISNLNALKKRTDDLLIKSEEYKVSRTNKDARVKNEDIRMRLTLVMKLQDELGLDSKYTDQVSINLGKDNVQEAELQLVLAEQQIYEQKDIVKAAKKIFGDYLANTNNFNGQNYYNANEFNYHSFDKLFNASMLNTNKYEPAEAAFPIMYIVNYFNTIRRISPAQFYNSYKAALASLPKDNNVMSYEQEMIVKQMVGHAYSGGDRALSVTLNDMCKNSLGDASYVINNALAIRGFAGTGKTTTMSKVALAILTSLSGRKPIVSIVTPSSALSAKFSDVVKDNVHSASLGQFSTIDVGFGANLSTNIIIVDEASFLNNKQLQSINSVMSELNTPRSGNNKVVLWAFGDQSQMTPSVDAERFSPFESSMERTLPASTVYRSDVADISSVQQALRDAIFYRDRPITLPNTKYDAIQSEGVQYALGSKNESFESVITKPRAELGGVSIYDQFIQDLKDPNKVNNTTLIVFNKEERGVVLKKMTDEGVNNTIDESILENSVKHLEEADGSILGQDTERAYVALSEVGREKVYKKAMLTAASRAKKFLFLFNTDPSASSSEGTIIKTAPESIEEKTKKLGELNTRLDAIVSKLPAVTVQRQSSQPVTPTPPPPAPAGAGTGNHTPPPAAKPKKKKVTKTVVKKAKKAAAAKKPTKAEQEEIDAKLAEEKRKAEEEEAKRKAAGKPVKVGTPEYNKEGENVNRTTGRYSADIFNQPGNKTYVSLAVSSLPGSYDDDSSLANKHLKKKTQFLTEAMNSIGSTPASRLTVSYKKKSTLNSDGGKLSDFKHVIELHADPNEFARITNTSVEEVLKDNLNLIGVISSIDVDPVLAGSNDSEWFSNPGLVDKTLKAIDIKFKGDEAQLAYNRHLVALRVEGAKSVNGDVGNFNIVDVVQGKLVFSAAKGEIPFSYLVDNINKKGFVWDGTIVQNMPIPNKAGVDMKRSAIKISAVKGGPETIVIVNTPDVTVEEFNKLNGKLPKLKKLPTIGDVRKSDSYQFIVFNDPSFDQGQETKTSLIARMFQYYRQAEKNILTESNSQRYKSNTAIVREGNVQKIVGTNYTGFTTKVINVNFPSLLIDMSKFKVSVGNAIKTEDPNAAAKSAFGNNTFKRSTASSLDDMDPSLNEGEGLPEEGSGNTPSSFEDEPVEDESNKDPEEPKEAREFRLTLDKYSDFHSLSKVFGSDSNSQLIRRTVASFARSFSNYNRNIFTDSLNFNQAIKKTHEFIKDLSEKNGLDVNQNTLANGKVINSITEITGEDYKYIEDDGDRAKYVYYSLSKSDVFYKLISKSFGTIDIEALIADKSVERNSKNDNVDYSLEDAIFDNAESNIHEDNSKKNYIDSMSNFNTWNLESLPKRTYTLLPSGDISYTETPGKFVNQVQLHKDIIKIFSKVGPVNFEQKLRTTMNDAMHKRAIQVNEDGSKSYSESGNDLLTFFTEFFNPHFVIHKYSSQTASFELENWSTVEQFTREFEKLDDASKAQTMANGFSHLLLANNINNLVNAFPQRRDELISKAMNSTSLLNATVSTFKSISTKPFVYWEFSNGNVRMKHPQSSEAAGVKNEFTKSLNSKLLDATGNIRPSHKIAINGGKYDVTDDLIRSNFGSGKVLIRIDKKGSKPSFSFEKNVGYDDIKKLASFLGLRLRKQTINAYLNSVKGSETQSYKLAEALGVFMISTKAFADKAYDASVLDYYYNRGEAISEEFKVSDSGEATKEEDQEVNESIEPRTVTTRRPSDFFLLKEELSNVESASRGEGYNSLHYGVKGSALFADTFTSTAHRLLGNSDDNTDASTMLKSNPDYIGQVNPSFKINGKIFNIFADPNSISKVVRMDLGEGGKEKGGFRAKTFDQLKGLDYIRLTLDGTYFEGLMKSVVGTASEEIHFLYHPMSKRKLIPKFVTTLAIKDQSEKLISKKGNRVENNYGLVANHFLRIFSHNIAKQNLSVDNWVQALITAPESIEITPDDVKVWKSDPIKFKRRIDAIMSDARAQGKSEALISHLNKTGLLIKNHDILIENGLPTIGNASFYGAKPEGSNTNPIFNIRQHYRFLKFIGVNQALRAEGKEQEADKQLKYYIMNLIKGSYRSLVGELNKSRYRIPVKIETMLSESQRDYENDIKTEGQYDNIVEGDFNPMYESFVYASLINNYHLDELLLGESTTYSSTTDFFARAGAPTTPGKSGSLLTPSSIPSKIKLAIVDMFPEKKKYAELNNNDGTKVFDGYSISNPIFHHLLQVSDGEKMGQLGNSMTKPQYSFAGTLLKTGTMPITGFMYNNSDFYKSMFRRMNGPVLNSMFDEFIAQGETFDSAIKKIGIAIMLNPQLKDDIKVHIAADPSSVKNGANHLNGANDAEFTTMNLLSEHFQIVLNPSQDIENTDLAPSTQKDAIAGVGPQNAARAARISNLQIVLAESFMSKMKEQISKFPGSQENKIREFLRSVGEAGARNIGGVSKFVEQISDKEMNIDIPTMRHQIRNLLINKINRNAIKPKQNGVRMNQAPGEGLQIYDTEFGPMVKADAEKAGLTVIGPGRSLKPMTWGADGAVSPSEIIMPFSYVKQFGFTPGMSLTDMRNALIDKPEQLQAFEESLNVLLSRTPYGSPGAGFIGRVIAFHEDAGNAVFIPEEHNILTGGDFDIDQLSDFFSFIEDDGTLPKEGYDKVRNDLLKELIGYYNDPANKDYILSPTDLTEIKQVAKELAPESTESKGFIGDPATSIRYQNKIMDGEGLTGILANESKGYQYTMMANEAAQNNGQAPLVNGWNLDKTGYSSDGKTVLSKFGNAIDASTTNEKTLLMGSVNASPELANIVSGAIASGLSEKDVYGMLMKPTKYPVVNKIVNNMRRHRDMNGDSKNQFGKSYTIFDAIEDAIEHSAQYRPSEFINFERLTLKRDSPLTKKMSLEDRQQLDKELFEAQVAWEKKLPETQAEINENIERLNSILHYAKVGESLKRVASIAGINSKGISTDDFDSDKYIKNAEFLLGQSVGSFLANEPIQIKDAFLSYQPYMDGEVNDPSTELGRYYALENELRAMINIPEVIRNLPYVKKMLSIALEQKNMDSIAFLQDGKLFNDVQQSFLLKVKQPDFVSDSNKYLFMNEMWKYMDALFFDKYYYNKNDQFKSMVNLYGQSFLNIATPGGRYKFGQQFPVFLKSIIEKGKADGDVRITENAFINSLNITNAENLAEEDRTMFITRESSKRDTPEMLAEARDAFTKLDDFYPGLTEMIWVYSKMRYSFNFGKGSLIDAIGLTKYDIAYSDFLTTFKAAASSEEDSNWTFGDGTSVNIKNVFDPFVDSVGAYNTELLRQESKDFPFTERNRPLLEKKYYKEMGLTLVQNNETKTSHTGAYINRYNQYDVKAPSITDEQVLKTSSYANDKKWWMGEPIKITFSSKVHYTAATKANPLAGIINMPDGSKGIITQASSESNSTIIHIKPMDLYNKENIKRVVLNDSLQDIVDRSKSNLNSYMGIATKQEFAKHAENHGTTEYVRELFTALNSLHNSKTEQRVGRVMFKTKLNDRQLMQDSLRPEGETAAYYNTVTKDIVINKSVINGSGFRIEKLFAHEMLHDYTLSALDPLADINSLNAHQRDFRSKMNTLYDSAKSWAQSNGINTEKVYGFDDLSEFTSEAFGNSSFQKMLMAVPAVDAVKTKSNLFQKFISTLTDFLSNMTGIHIDNGMLSQVINLTGDYISGTEFFESVYSKNPKMRPNGRVNARNSDEYMDEVDNIVNSLMGNLTKIC